MTRRQQTLRTAVEFEGVVEKVDHVDDGVDIGSAKPGGVKQIVDRAVRERVYHREQVYSVENLNDSVQQGYSVKFHSSQYWKPDG